MDPSKLEREVLILQRCNSETAALNRALDPASFQGPPPRQGAAGFDATAVAPAQPAPAQLH